MNVSNQAVLNMVLSFIGRPQTYVNPKGCLLDLKSHRLMEVRKESFTCFIYRPQTDVNPKGCLSALISQRVLKVRKESFSCFILCQSTFSACSIFCNIVPHFTQNMKNDD